RTWGKDDRYLIGIEKAELRDPLGLLSTMARHLSHIHLFARGRLPREVPDGKAVSDLLTVYLGLGVVTANAVVRERTTTETMGSRGQIERRGERGMPTYASALPRFALSRGDGGRRGSRELRLDVRSSSRGARRYLAARVPP